MILGHFFFFSPEWDQPPERDAPITFTSLQERHLPQVHDILERSFWTGIDGRYYHKILFFRILKNPGSVSDSLVYEPEKATVVATYKHLVVGVAILSSPIETYITYLAVRAGWDNSQIATYVSSTLACPNNNNNTGTDRCCTILYGLIQTRISRYMYPLTIPPWYVLRNPYHLYGYLN